MTGRWWVRSWMRITIRGYSFGPAKNWFEGI